MNTKVEVTGSWLDILKLVIALAIVITAIAGFYFYSDQSLLYRVIGLLACAAVAAGIALQTDKGRQLWSYFQDAQVEVRRVVWPTREETVQTTLIVIGVVIVVSIILWVLDMLLSWSIGALLGR